MCPGLPLQGYLAHDKTPTPLGPSYGPRHGPTIGSRGGAVSYGRGTPIACGGVSGSVNPVNPDTQPPACQATYFDRWGLANFYLGWPISGYSWCKSGVDKRSKLFTWEGWWEAFQWIPLVSCVIFLVQGYLAHKKEPPPRGRHRALGIFLL